jgi:citrate synthase
VHAVRDHQALADDPAAVADLLHLRVHDLRIYANVEFYASIVLDAIGLPRQLFTPTFAAAA